MKVIKDSEHGILANCFGLNDRFYLSVAVMTFFSFDNPDLALSEQELWPFVQGELGKETVFDMAMPKPKGEVLVWGKCFSPDGRPTPASQVHFRMGAVEKGAYVFGDRHWNKTALGMTISDPEPFVEMPVTYERAFGGKSFERNPAGKGMDAVNSASGNEARPLPNIEDPKHLIGSPGDRPEPRGFGPLDCAWPQRSKKLGAYDNKWFRERWPFYPEDMDWTYFNAAPEDQQMEVFFNGNEKFTFTNMHKTKPSMESRLPNLRRRLFINQRADKGKPEGEDIFREVRTHIDTVWLFPHAERGIVVHRGSAEVRDDEAADVLHVYITTEDPSAQAKTIDRCHEEFKKRLERKIPEQAAAAMAEAKKSMAEAAESLRDLPQEMADSFARASGQAPVPVRTINETVARLSALDDKMTPLIDDAEKRLIESKTLFGHLMKVDTNAFQGMRRQFAESRARLQAVPALVEGIDAGFAACETEMKEVYKKALGKIDPALLKEKGINPDMDSHMLKKTPQEMWHERGMRFIERCMNDLHSRPEYMGILENMGLRRYTIKRAWLGINPVPGTDDPALWGLPGEDGSRKNPKELDLFSGLVLPCFDKAKLHRIQISSWHDIYPPPDFPSLTFKTGRKIARDFLIEGSGDMAMVQGAGEGKPFVRVAYQFESLLLHQDAGAFCAVIAMKTPDMKPDKETAELLKKAPRFLILQYPESEEPADHSMDAWTALYPQAEPLMMPGGANLFEARMLGVDLWKWVADALGPGISPDPATNPGDVDISKPGALASLVPIPDVRALIAGNRKRVMAKIQPELDRFKKGESEIMAKARALLESKGLDGDELLKAPKPSPEGANPFAGMEKEYADQFSLVRKHLGKNGLLTADLEKQIAEAERSCAGLLTGAGAEYEEAMARVKSMKKMPDWEKKLLADAGIDPDDPRPSRRLTREDVMERYGLGLAFAGLDLSGLDLSGLDLRRGDFKNTDLGKTKLSGSKLDDADFTRARAGEADFSHASMRKARMTKGFFGKAKFTGADLSESDCSGAIMSEADLSGATMRAATLEKVTFQGTNLKKTNFSDARAVGGNFLSVEALNANFSGADLTKATFLKSNIEEANFSGAAVRSTTFLETKGRNVNFAGADMSNSRIAVGSSLAESAFTDVKADQARWMKSDLAGSDFRGMVMKRGIIEECNLSGANLSGVSAKETRITRTDLSDAKMKKVNLFRGSLRKSKLVRTDLTEANLYGVEFYRTGVGDTRLDGANLKMTKLHKRADLLPEKKEKG
jgi:uncharacterized protein YjbI with pentapeptide repeats